MSFLNAVPGSDAGCQLCTAYRLRRAKTRYELTEDLEAPGDAGTELPESTSIAKTRIGSPSCTALCPGSGAWEGLRVVA